MGRPPGPRSGGGPPDAGFRHGPRPFDNRRGPASGPPSRPERGYDRPRFPSGQGPYRSRPAGPPSEPARGREDRNRPPFAEQRPWAGPPDRHGGRAPRAPWPGGDVRRPWIRPEPRPTAPSTAGLMDEGEELVAGRRPVEEAFVARRPAIRLLVVPQRRQALERLVLHATNLRIPIVEVEGGTLTAIAGFDGHQGVALVVEARRFASVDEILARAIERAEPPFVLVLDSLEDPQNVGTLLRSAEAAGIHGVVFPTRRQAPLSPAAVKASAGAVEHLLLSPVDDLGGALSDLRIRGLRVVGAEAGAPLTARQSDLRGPLAIVVGSEGQGLSPAVRRRCDFVVRIPMRGAIGSLNAAVAGSVLLFEAVAQRDPDGRAGPAGSPGAIELDQADGPQSPEAASEPGPGEPQLDQTEPHEPTDGGSDAPETVADDLLPGGPDADATALDPA
jgi:23S rRNA (guanosine2251-2'-O)-methyltransferase